MITVLRNGIEVFSKIKHLFVITSIFLSEQYIVYIRVLDSFYSVQANELIVNTKLLSQHTGTYRGLDSNVTYLW